MASEDNNNNNNNKEEAPKPLQRDVEAGMNPVSLLTGFYGDRGSRIRHRVHKGALMLPRTALDMMMTSSGDGDDDEKSPPSKKATYTLPGLDSVVRPSVDPAKESYTVTEVYSEDTTTERVNPEDGTIQKQTSTKTVTKNRVVVTKDPDRIRGGGGEEEEEKEKEKEETGATPGTSAVEEDTSRPQQQADTTTPAQDTESKPTEDVTMEDVSEPPTDAQAAAAADGPPAVDAPPSAAPPAAATTTTTTTTTEEPPPAGEHINQKEPEIATATPVPVPAPDQNVSAAPAAESSMAAPVPTTSASAPPPADVTSSTSNAEEATASTVASSDIKAPSEPVVMPLKKRPAAQWEQHISATNEETEMKVDVASKVPKPEWYKPDGISSLERTVLSEWFDSSASHRTPESYMQAREKLIEMSVNLGHNRFVTTTMARRSIPGDAGSLLRLHSFLTTYALINEDAINDSAPSPICFQKRPPPVAQIDDDLRDKLMHSVVEVVRKRPKLETPGAVATIDWDEVATSVGHGLTPADCERQFLAMPMDNDDDDEVAREGSITPDTTTATTGQDEAKDRQEKGKLQQEILKDLVDKTDPAVVSAVTKAALEATESLSQAQRAGAVGLVASQAVAEARSKEDAVTRILAEVVDLRMKKLENRLSLLDDVEGMLDAERVALELERRDLYTARCRHWFGGT